MDSWFIFLIFLVLIFSNLKNEYKLTQLVIIQIKQKLGERYKFSHCKIFFIYLFLSALIFTLLTFSGVRLFNSLNLAMTISSLGGFLPSNDLKEIIKSNPQKFFFH